MESTYARGGIQDYIPPGEESRSSGQMHQALWRQFAAAETPESYYQSWLALQCSLISGVSTGVVMLQTSADAVFAPVAFWPDVPQDRGHLAEVAERMLLEGRGVVLKRATPGLDDGPPQVHYYLAYPLRIQGRLHSIIALDMAPRSARQIQAVMRQLQWGSAWLTLFLQRQTPQTASQGHAPVVLEFLATLLEPDQIYVRIYIPETELGHVKVGQDAEIRVDSFPNKAFAGVVEQINQQAEFLPRNVQTREERVHQVFGVKVRINDPSGQVRAGMAADVKLKATN